MRTITAMFDSRSDAEDARRELSALGISEDDVTILDQTSVGQAGSTTTPGQSTGGLWESFKALFTDDHDTYAEGLRRGGYLLTARVGDDQADRAIDILDDEGTVDLEQRSSAWRNEGWTGGSTATAYGDGNGDTATEQRIPIVEEQLTVGKREVSRGGVRVRSYVTETPVHEEVRLREEHVSVERRPASGYSAADAGDLLRERTIEVSETAEEAVVSKTAQVREEVVVGKTVDERVERIDDSVRRTDVDVERTGGTSGAYGASTTRDGDRDHGSTGSTLGGFVNEGIGNAKQGLGGLTGSDSLRQEGVAQERHGEAQQDSGRRADNTRVDSDNQTGGTGTSRTGY